MWKQQLDDQKKMMQMETKSVCSIIQLYTILYNCFYFQRKKKTKHYPRSTSNSDTDSVELVSPKIVEPALRRTVSNYFSQLPQNNNNN